MLRGSAKKEIRVKAQFSPPESIFIGRAESVTLKGLWDPTQNGWQTGDCAEWRVRA